jgi:heptosyltransferase II
MNILIRLPNWLGDMVMSTAFVQAVKNEFPHAQIHLVAKKGIDFLLDHFPAHQQRFVFAKETHKGLQGAWKFGKMISREQNYDLFFCLPDSFSSAVMGYATGSNLRIGFRKEMRSVLMTHGYNKKNGLHRVEEYIDLLRQFTKKQIDIPPVKLDAGAVSRNGSLIININSEASSRRLPAEKAVSIINAVRRSVPNDIILVGSPKEAAFVNDVYDRLNDRSNIFNKAGKTNMGELLPLLAAASAMLTTDSGPAHVANALGVHTTVLFGAGNEHNTAPYNKDKRTITRLGQLPCEPCVSNVCKVYGTPECLLRLDERLIVAELKRSLLSVDQNNLL